MLVNVNQQIETLVPGLFCEQSRVPLGETAEFVPVAIVEDLDEEVGTDWP
jgi:hypothetical protein